MKPKLYHLAALSATCSALCSCDTTEQRVDYSWFRDTIALAEDDLVTVEAGSGLSEEEAAAPAAPPEGEITSPPAAVATVAAPVEPQSADQQPTGTAPLSSEQQPVATGQQSLPATTPSATSEQVEGGAISQRQPAPEITVPATTPATTPATYTVKKGDSLSVIARRHNVGMAALIRANNITNPNALRIGQVLTIPSTAPQPSATAPAPQQATPTPAAPATSAARYHTVRAGDTLSRIARLYNTTIAKIIQANGMTHAQANRLSIGQRILLPSN